MEYEPYEPDREYVKTYLPDGSTCYRRIERWMRLLDYDGSDARSRECRRKARRLIWLWPEPADLYRR
jgi:hypothetical protein